MPARAPIGILAKFQQELVGNWKNLDFGKDDDGDTVGGEENPLSYNIMPLPQTSDPYGYILKNFKYHEKLHFNSDDPEKALAIAARAPNRGGRVNQDARAIFYEQQVKFAEGPQGPRANSADGDVVHVENGTWLWLPRYVQGDGPYQENPPGSGLFPPPTDLVSDGLQQPADALIAKQISVPHGNSILALGTFDTRPGHNGAGPWKGDPKFDGSPSIPDGPSPYPVPANPVPAPTGTPTPATLVSDLNIDQRFQSLQNSSSNFQNPHPDLTLNPNRPLQKAVHIINPDGFMHWHVTTKPLTAGKGVVTNIPFEHRVSEVTDYIADYWLLFKGGKKYLAYTQTILMKLTIKEQKYFFPHLTCNVVTYCD
ncbi:MAG TPA: hypothetical protein VMF08_16530 [Candidatus Sulfotelmatobacter sp.]|nr:hypothetical protein [Candidatus Sulfotelmatobacter sp.]